MDTKGLLIAILVVVVFAVGFFIGRVTASQDVAFTGSGVSSADDSSAQNSGVERDESNTSEATEGTTVSSADLTEGQRKLLETLGINADEVTITPEMIACAEAKLGPARLGEIQGGDTPSFMEGASLVACYK